MSLVITIGNDTEQPLKKNIIVNIFTQMFTVFTNLRYLNFDPRLNYQERLSIDPQCPKFFCSTLRELHVNLDDFKTCLYLLDGRFNQLDTFYVNITSIEFSNPKIINEVGYKNKYVIY